LVDFDSFLPHLTFTPLSSLSFPQPPRASHTFVILSHPLVLTHQAEYMQKRKSKSPSAVQASISNNSKGKSKSEGHSKSEGERNKSESIAMANKENSGKKPITLNRILTGILGACALFGMAYYTNLLAPTAESTIAAASAPLSAEQVMLVTSILHDKHTTMSLVTHTHEHIHVCICTHAHTQKHTYTYSRTQTHTYTCAHRRSQ
jgi:hypothetical protein